ncbi:MAG TPA: hypothetical protein VFC03_22600, partial [Acidimicrobiales bacterium]|nr:hypothetical protein [Acidimicrobiales bacterium]
QCYSPPSSYGLFYHLRDYLSEGIVMKKFARAIFAAVVVFTIALILNLNGIGFNGHHDHYTGIFL